MWFVVTFHAFACVWLGNSITSLIIVIMNWRQVIPWTYYAIILHTVLIKSSCYFETVQIYIIKYNTECFVSVITYWNIPQKILACECQSQIRSVCNNEHSLFQKVRKVEIISYKEIILVKFIYYEWHILEWYPYVFWFVTQVL